MKHGSLFSGIGGFDLAAEWAGWENAFHCELNPFGRKVLHHYWPEATSYEDITKADFSVWRGRIDVLTGGFPCQPYSMAGKRLGKEDERHLWPAMLAAIRAISPRWVVGENVLGLVNWNGGLVFDEVQADLEAEGYSVQPYVLPAAGVNAPHRRDRVWFVAHAFNRGHSAGREEISQENGISGIGGKEMDSGKFDGAGVSRIAADSTSQQGERMRHEQRELGEQKQGELGGNHSGMGSEWDAANANSKMLEYRDGQREAGVAAIAQERAESFGSPRKWESFPTQSPIHNRDDGFSRKLVGITVSRWRNESIKACGNAIVPQVAYQIFQAINAYESMQDSE